MNSEWKEFLQKAGAEFSEAGVTHYGNLPRELSVAITGNVFADLSHYGLVSVHGEDAQDFLQSQFSNDIRQVDDTHSQYSGYCSAKGRLLASFRIFRRGDSYYLCLPAEMIEDLISRLRMFVLRSKVTIEEAGNTFVYLGVSGGEASEKLCDISGDLPESVHEVIQDEEQLTIRVPGIHPSYEVFTSVERARVLWDKLNVDSAAIGAEAWQLLDIQAGVPVIYRQTRESFVPQMANMQLVDAVSFKKGCYPGQEVVARMQYLGKLKRRMYKLRTHTEIRPEPGDELFRGEDASQSTGKVVSAAAHPDGGYALLAVLQISSAEGGGDLHLGASDGPGVVIEPLPYPFSET